MSYRGFGPASPYRKGIEFIARTCYDIEGETVLMRYAENRMIALRAMLQEMTGRSEQTIIDDIHNKLEHLKLVARQVSDEMPRP